MDRYYLLVIDGRMKMNLNEILEPELLAMSYALFVLGNALKKSKKISDENIPCILGIVGIVFCTVHIFVTEDFCNMKMIVSGILRGIIRGICVAGMSVYVHQMLKQTILKE